MFFRQNIRRRAAARFREALIKASLPNFNFYWLGKWPPQ
jgi:hypothetical protein